MKNPKTLVGEILLDVLQQYEIPESLIPDLIYLLENNNNSKTDLKEQLRKLLDNAQNEGKLNNL